MLNKLDLSKILFIDIETVAQKGDWDELSEGFQKLWTQKAGQIYRNTSSSEELDIPQSYYDKAGIYAEYGKIVCISVGVLIVERKTKRIECRIKSFKSHDEKELLADFCEMVVQYYNDPEVHSICGHNIREFDIPYICRRLLINEMTLPYIFKIPGRKPWQTQFLLDTLTLWKFGDYKNYTSLKLLTAVFNIPSPKDDIDGSDVNKVYWEDDDLSRIAKYCEKDVLAVIQLLFKFKGLPLLEANQIQFV